MFCKHSDRITYEVPGGHREEGESIEETAKRELYEETGATEYDMKQICVYSVQKDGGQETFGMLYYAEVTLLLIDRWKGQEALDIYHKSEMMTQIAKLRDKYRLRLRAERYHSENKWILRK